MVKVKDCKNCGAKIKSIHSPYCYGCDVDNYSKWIPQKPIPKSEYPEPDESKWPPNAKLSKGELNLDKFLMKLDEILRIEGDTENSLGEITSDGERGYICTHCGKTITKAHHIKPEMYKVIYKGQTFYMEKHVCDDCMNEYKKD